jgi:hypothetical protein
MPNYQKRRDVRVEVADVLLCRDHSLGRERVTKALHTAPQTHRAKLLQAVTLLRGDR